MLIDILGRKAHNFKLNRNFITAASAHDWLESNGFLEAGWRVMAIDLDDDVNTPLNCIVIDD
jgi:hypothetical protein